MGGVYRSSPIDNADTIWASKGFRHGFERIKPRRYATALWGKLKINDTNVVTFHPAFMAVLSERAAA